MTIAGKRSGKVNSHLLANFRCADTGGAGGRLADRLQDDWRADLSQTVVRPSRMPSWSRSTLPVSGLRDGTVWQWPAACGFGFAAARREGRERVDRRRCPRCGRAGTVITYFDDDRQQPSGDRRCAVPIEIDYVRRSARRTLNDRQQEQERMKKTYFALMAGMLVAGRLAVLAAETAPQPYKHSISASAAGANHAGWVS